MWNNRNKNFTRAKMDRRIAQIEESIKTDILALLQPTENSRTSQNWHAFFDKCAGVIELDGGLPPRVSV